MKIIYTPTNEVIATILGGNKMTKDEAIEFVADVIYKIGDEEYCDDGENIVIKGNRYWSEDLDTIVD